MKKKIAILFTVLFFSSVIIFAENLNLNKKNIKVVFFPFQQQEISSLLDCNVTKYHLNEGDHFKKGEILMEMDSTIYSYALDKAEAELEKNQASDNYSDEVFRQNKGLFSKDAIGKDEYLKSFMEKETTDADATTAVVNKKLAERNLNLCTVHAPWNGVLIKKLIHENENLKMNEPMFIIAEDSKLLATMYIPSRQVENLKKGMTAKIKVDETGNICEGKIYTIAGSINTASRTIKVEVLVDNKDLKLKPGMSGTLISLS